MLRAGRLRRDVATDVLVIGAGVSGALIAQGLAEAGFKVIVIDRRRPAAGATAASTALLQYEIDVPMLHLNPLIGVEKTLRIWRRSYLALQTLRARTTRLKIAASLRDHNSLYLAGDLLDAAQLREECALRRCAGFEVQWLSPRQVRQQSGIVGRAALLAFGALSCDPRRLTAGYLHAAMRQGAVVHSYTEAVDVEPGRTVVTGTKHGPTVKSRYLVFATGYEMPKGVPHMGHRIRSTWAMATRPLTPPGPLVWEASHTYMYLRPGPGGRLLCGGEDEDFVDENQRDALTPQKIQTLERKLHGLMPKIDARAERAWCGSFGSSPTGTPTMGPVPGMPGCHAVFGYGGNGITFSTIAAQLLCAQLRGEHDADADLFSFHRRWSVLRRRG